VVCLGGVFLLLPAIWWEKYVVFVCHDIFLFAGNKCVSWCDSSNIFHTFWKFRFWDGIFFVIYVVFVLVRIFVARHVSWPRNRFWLIFHFCYDFYLFWWISAYYIVFIQIWKFVIQLWEFIFMSWINLVLWLGRIHGLFSLFLIKCSIYFLFLKKWFLRKCWFAFVNAIFYVQKSAKGAKLVQLFSGMLFLWILNTIFQKRTKILFI